MSLNATLSVLPVSGWLLAVAVLLGSCLVFVALGRLDVGSVREIARDQNGLRYLFSPLVGAIVTGTAVVVSITEDVIESSQGIVFGRNSIN